MKMDSGVAVNLTEDEAELYDRQIRLWGLEAQQRLRKAKILLIGISPTSSEIAKNIVLSGINSLTLMDDKKVTDVDISHNFMLPSDSIGENRSASALSMCQELNPMVSLDVKEEHYSVLAVDDLKNFDLTCLAAENPSRSSIIDLNEKCRKANCKLIIVNSFGHYGYSFSDLIDHDYAEEEIPVPSEKNDGPPAKKPKTDENNSFESRMVKKNVKFCSFFEALSENWSSTSKRILRRTSPVYFILQSMLQVIDNNEKIDMKSLKFAWKSYAEKQNIDNELVSEDRLSRCEGVVTPVFPILGGIVAQEVIKTVSHKDSPLRNFFFFDADDCSGTVNAIGPLSSSKQ